MERIREQSEAARKKGYISLILLRDIMALLNCYDRPMLEKLYRRYACEELSKKSFQEIIKQAQAVASTGGTPFDSMLSGNDRATAQKETDLFKALNDRAGNGRISGQISAGDLLWRYGVWYWVMLRWAGINHHYCDLPVENDKGLLLLYYRTPDGGYERIKDTYAPNWHHCTKLSDVKALLHSLDLPLPALLHES